MIKIATLGLVLRRNEKGETEILLAKKKKTKSGFGVGKWVGGGGKQEPNETLKECLRRETRKELEIELDPASLELVAVIIFYAAGEIDFVVYVYRAEVLSGEVHETEEMLPRWYRLNLRDLPLEDMFSADKLWIMDAAKGKKSARTSTTRDRARGLSESSSFRSTSNTTSLSPGRASDARPFPFY